MPTATDKDSNSSERPSNQVRKPTYRKSHLQSLWESVANDAPLNAALSQFSFDERASFHMPGHKCRLELPGAGEPARHHDPFRQASAYDLTELPGLDDLSYPHGVLQGLEQQIADLYRVEKSILSVGGASVPLMASLLSVARRGSEILVPRNAHRSIIHALVLSGLNPLWYEPQWHAAWGLWGEVNAVSLGEALAQSARSGKLAGVVVVSPTFAGAISDIASLSNLAHEHKVPLIVDEAHGAHLLPGSVMPTSAAACGADLVVHSFHKTLGALTGTGAVHISHDSLVPVQDVRAALALVQTSSPSYLLMASVEQAIAIHKSQGGLENLARLVALSDRIRAKAAGMEFYTPGFQSDPLHLTLRLRGVPAAVLASTLEGEGIFVESVLGSGCLLMLGAGSEECDVDMLIDTISKSELLKEQMNGRDEDATAPARPPAIEQVVSPREAFFAVPHMVSLKEAVGKVSADCIAPCPPGVPVVVPGSRVPVEILELESQIAKLRVVADGP